jgi:hypothetical protein
MVGCSINYLLGWVHYAEYCMSRWLLWTKQWIFGSLLCGEFLGQLTFNFSRRILPHGVCSSVSWLAKEFFRKLCRPVGPKSSLSTFVHPMSCTTIIKVFFNSAGHSCCVTGLQCNNCIPKCANRMLTCILRNKNNVLARNTCHPVLKKKARLCTEGWLVMILN